MSSTTERSGQLRVRLPVELHTALAELAERQGVSLNTLIVALLAGAITYRGKDSPHAQLSHS
jgi:predicted HicB family RNase H-like nuclease